MPDLRLPDPRRFADPDTDDVLVAAARMIGECDEDSRPSREAALVAQVSGLLAAGDARAITRAIAAAPGAAAARILHRALARAIASTPPGEDGVQLRTFAIPIVIVAGAARRTVIPAVLSDVGEVAAVLERHGALGQTRNFGLSNALCDYGTMQTLSPEIAYRATQSLDRDTLAQAVAPCDIVVAPGREQAHLRFLVGAGLIAPHAPSLAETASNVGAWGMECSRTLGRALVQPGLQLLVLPRPPTDLVRAPQMGRKAELEVALHLFVSNAVRQMRLQIGDPTAILSSHDDADVRLTLSSVLADDLVEGFRWPLHLLDELSEVQQAFEALLREVRVSDVRVVGRVLPSQRPSGGLWFPRVGEWDDLAPTRPH